MKKVPIEKVRPIKIGLETRDWINLTSIGAIKEPAITPKDEIKIRVIICVFSLILWFI